MSKNLGALAVVVLKARNLPNKSIWKQDPYVVVRFEGAGQRTHVDERGGQHPVWDDEFRFPVADTGATERLLKLSVFTKELRVDDLIGEASVDVSDCLVRGEFDDWVKLTRAGRDVGEIYLEMTFYAAAPPIGRRPSKLSPHDRLWRPPQTPPKTPSPGRSPGTSAQHLPVPSQQPPRNNDPPVSNPRQHRPPETGLPPAALERTHLTPKPQPAPLPATSDSGVPAALRPHGGVPTSPPKPTGTPLPAEQPAGLPAPHIPYRPPPQLDDFLSAPPVHTAPRTAHGPSLQPVPSILRPAHVRQHQDPDQAAPAVPARPGAKTAHTKAAQEAEDARFAAELARAEGIDIDRLRAEEADADLARRLAAENELPPIPGAFN